MSLILKTFSVALDIKRPVSNRDFEVVEGDSGNALEITLTDGGVPIDLTGCRVLAVFSKSTGTAMQDSAAEGGGITLGGTDGNVIFISLFTTSFAPGAVECELQVYSGESQSTLVTSAKFNFKCRRSILNENTIAATNEYPLLTGLISQGVLCLIPNVDTVTRWVMLLYFLLPASYLAPGLGRSREDSVLASGVCSLLTAVALVVFCIISAFVA